jgi:hypothetical protein
MPSVRRLAAILDASLARNSSLIGADEQAASVAKLPAAYFVTLNLVVVFAIGIAAWWAWRLVSQELAAVYAEAFRAAGSCRRSEANPPRHCDRNLCTGRRQERSPVVAAPFLRTFSPVSALIAVPRSDEAQRLRLAHYEEGVSEVRLKTSRRLSNLRLRASPAR